MHVEILCIPMLLCVMSNEVQIIVHDDRCSMQIFVHVKLIEDGKRKLPGSPAAKQEDD